MRLLRDSWNAHFHSHFPTDSSKLQDQSKATKMTWKRLPLRNATLTTPVKHFFFNGTEYDEL